MSLLPPEENDGINDVPVDAALGTVTEVCGDGADAMETNGFKTEGVVATGIAVGAFGTDGNFNTGKIIGIFATGRTTLMLGFNVPHGVALGVEREIPRVTGIRGIAIGAGNEIDAPSPYDINDY